MQRWRYLSKLVAPEKRASSLAVEQSAVVPRVDANQYRPNVVVCEGLVHGVATDHYINRTSAPLTSNKVAQALVWSGEPSDPTALSSEWSRSRKGALRSPLAQSVAVLACSRAPCRAVPRMLRPIVPRRCSPSSILHRARAA